MFTLILSIICINVVAILCKQVYTIYRCAVESYKEVKNNH